MKLLVSVRNAAEAEQALEAGVDLLDVKEPRNGPLGAADSKIVDAVRRLSSGRVPVSVALGELSDFRFPRHSGKLNLLGTTFAKVGLSQMKTNNDWEVQCQRFAHSLPAGTKPVAVAYADWNQAFSPHPEHVLSNAIELGWSAFLIDTHDKSGGSVRNHLVDSQLAELIGRAHQAGVLAVLAGSLDVNDIEWIAELAAQPDFVGVRGAVCRAGRDSTLDPAMIRCIRDALNSAVRN